VRQEDVAVVDEAGDGEILGELLAELGLDDGAAVAVELAAGSKETLPALASRTSTMRSSSAAWLSTALRSAGRIWTERKMPKRVSACRDCVIFSGSYQSPGSKAGSRRTTLGLVRMRPVMAMSPTRTRGPSLTLTMIDVVIVLRCSTVDSSRSTSA
jgi:hypothetical protein